MKFDLIQCSVRLNHDGDNTKTEIVRAGVDALTPPEIVLLQMQHGTDDSFGGHAIRNAVKVGEIELDKQDIFDRISTRFRVDAKTIFPAPNLMPKTLADLELPVECHGRPRQEPVAESGPAQRKKELRKILTDAGVDVPKGNLSEDDLLLLLEEHGLKEKESA